MKSTRHDSQALPSLTDEALVSHAQAGSVNAFAEIVDRFEGRLFNFIARRLGGGGGRATADAEDLAQESFLRAWRSIGDFRPTHRFSTWLFTIAGRLVVDHLRHQRVQRAATETIARAATRRGHERQFAESPFTDNGLRNLWTIARDTLTEEQHAALWLRYAEDLSPREVARVLDRSEVSVRVMLFRARQTLAPHALEMLGDKEESAAMLTATSAAGGMT